MAKYDHIDFTPPQGVREEAAKALGWRREFGRGGTAVGVARARTLSNGTNITPETAKRMHGYFSRHANDKKAEGFKPGDSGFPSAGRIAWGLWGGDAGEAWARKLTSQIEAADSRSNVAMTKQSRIFCATGEGGGTDPSCSPKDAGGGGDKKFPGESGPGAKEKAKKVFEQQKDRADAKKYGDLPSSWTRISGNTGDGTAAASYGSAKSKNTHGATVYQYGDKWIAEFGKQSPADGRIKAKGRQTKIQPSRTEAIKWADKKAKDAGLVPSKAAAAKQAAGSGKKSPARPKVVDDISMFPGEAKYGGNMKAQLDAKKKKGRSTAPAAESRSLAVERRSLVLDNGADGQQTLCVESRCEHREEDGTETKRDYIVGYAAKFGVTSLDLGKFTERIAPSAFGLVSERRGRKKTLETRALFNHNADMPLAKYPGTLKLSVDDVGLRYEFPVPDTSYGRDLAANIRDGIVTGSSFSFTVPKDGESWSVEDGKSVRTVTRVDSLIDVGPVTYPAYPDTDTRVARRSYDHFRKSSEARTARRQRLKLVASRAAAEIKRFLAKHGR